MRVDMKDLYIVLFALHVAAAQGTTLDPEGSRTRALWDACLPLSLPEPGDPPITESWAMLVKMSKAYVQRADRHPATRPNPSIDNEDVPVYGAIWH